MRRFFAHLVLAFRLLSLAACKFMLPLPVSATLSQYKSGSYSQPVELSSKQLGALSEWFSQHKSGWKPSLVTYVPCTIIRIRHNNSDTTVVNIRGNHLVVYNQEGQYTQQFSQEDIDALFSILAITAG